VLNKVLCIHGLHVAQLNPTRLWRGTMGDYLYHLEHVVLLNCTMVASYTRGVQAQRPDFLSSSFPQLFQLCIFPLDFHLGSLE